MKVSHRLFLAVVPASIGVLAVAALAWWGRYNHAAPEWVIVAGAVSAIGSWLLAWGNTRYVARRIAEIAALRTAPGTDDELDSIARAVDQLSSDATTARADSRAHAAAVAARLDEYAVLLNEGAAAVQQQIGETRLALHIMLEHHFGPLNDNQEELLESARSSTELAETELGRLREIAELDRGLLSGRRDPVRIGELVRSLKPQLEADAARAGVTLSVEITPGLAAASGDRIRLQRAFELLLRHLVRRSLPGAALTLAVNADVAGIRVTLTGGPPPTLDADVAVARRIVAAHGGAVEIHADQTAILIPAAVK